MSYYDRKHSITIQTKGSTQNPVGGRNETIGYNNIATFRAAYVPNTGRMYMGGGEVHTESDCEFQIIYPLNGPILQPDMYVLHNNTSIRYLISAIIDVGGMHREMRIICHREK